MEPLTEADAEPPLNPNDLQALNLVHSLASGLWKQNAPIKPQTVPQPHLFPQPQTTPNTPVSAGTTTTTTRRIQPVQLSRKIIPTTINIGPGAAKDLTSQFFTSPPPPSTHFQSQNFHPDENPNHQNRGNGGAGPRRGRYSFPLEKKRVPLKSLPRKPPDIQNLGSFPPIGALNLNHDSQSTSKRVPLASSTSISSPQENPFTVANLKESNNTFDPAKERTKLTKGLQMVQSQIQNSSIAPSAVPVTALAPETQKSPTKKISRSTELFAEMSQETITKLVTLSSSYSSSLDSNTCRSLFNEIKFLIQLLVSNNTDPNYNSWDKSEHLLSTEASRAYFVTQVLEHQVESWIPPIGGNIYQMLIDFYPHRIPKALRTKIQNLIDKVHGEEQAIKSKLNFTGGFSTGTGTIRVIYHSETEGRNSFPHQKDAQDFSKQRDLFYAIKELWNISDHQASWMKMKQLLSINTSPTNLGRLGTLLLSQCILDELAYRNSVQSYTVDDENIQRIFESNPTKFEQLKQRLCSQETFQPQQHHGPIRDPFEFLKFLTQLLNMAKFNQHVVDRAVHEILQIEASIDSDFLSVLEQMKKLQFLAKTLGYLFFLPYRDEEFSAKKLNSAIISVETYIQSQISLRSWQSFPIDLQFHLETALRQRRLTITLPWIIEILAQADTVVYHLPHYKKLLDMVTALYREVLIVNPATESGIKLSPENRTFLRFICGKLFSSSGFPDSQLFQGTVGTGLELLNLNANKQNVEDDGTVILDMEPFIGVLLSPVYFYTETKEILQLLSGSAPVKGCIQQPGQVHPYSKPDRPIPEVPLTQEIPTNATVPKSQSTGNIQMDLESQFFLTQPPSLKKTVDFISERVASNFAKLLRNQSLLEIKKDLTRQRIFGQNATTECKKRIWKQLNEFASTRCNESVELLLGDVTSKSVLKLSQEITIRKSKEKILVWVDQHINSDLFPIVPEILIEPESTCVNATTRKEINVPAPTIHVFQVIALLHRSIKRLYSGLPISEDALTTILTDYRLLNKKHWIPHGTIDLALGIITFQPTLFTEPIQDLFLNFWKQMWTHESDTLLCSRNLIILAQSADTKQTWIDFSSIMTKLVNEKLISPLDLEESCLILLRQDWPRDVQQNIATLLRSLTPKMEMCEETEIVDWIAWYCSSKEDESAE